MTSPREADVAELVRVTGLMRKAMSACAGVDLGDGFGGVAEVADVFEVGDGFVGEVEEVFEDDAVELDDVELGLAVGDLGVEVAAGGR